MVIAFKSLVKFCSAVALLLAASSQLRADDIPDAGSSPSDNWTTGTKQTSESRALVPNGTVLSRRAFLGAMEKSPLDFIDLSSRSASFGASAFASGFGPGGRLSGASSFAESSSSASSLLDRFHLELDFGTLMSSRSTGSFTLNSDAFLPSTNSPYTLPRNPESTTTTNAPGCVKNCSTSTTNTVYFTPKGSVPEPTVLSLLAISGIFLLCLIKSRATA